MMKAIYKCNIFCGRPLFVCPKNKFFLKDCFPYVPIHILINIHLFAFAIIFIYIDSHLIYFLCNRGGVSNHRLISQFTF